MYKRQLWAWGNNDFGQLGDGTYDLGTSVPTQIGADNDWTAVAAGAYLSTAIKADGTLWAWGNNEVGRLGNGTNDQGTNVPVQVGLDRDWVAVDNSKFDIFEGYTLALKTDGSLWSWGISTAGALALGEGVQSINIPVSYTHLTLPTSDLV